MPISHTATPRPHDNCYWLAPHFLAGEYPGAKTDEAAVSRLIPILDAGVTFFVDLTEPGELAPYEPLLERLAAAGGRRPIYRRLPIRDVTIPRSPEAMAAILDTIDDALETGHTIYLHCWGGIGRTGTVAGCWLVRHGRSGADALELLAAHLQSMAKAYRVPRSPETDEQVTYVLGWENRR